MSKRRKTIQERISETVEALHKKPQDVKLNEELFGLLRMSEHIREIRVVDLREIVPAEWNDWFYEEIAENAPFTWGDNAMSLIWPETLLAYCLKVLDEEVTISGGGLLESPAWKAFAKSLKALEADGGIYINLEN